MYNIKYNMCGFFGCLHSNSLNFKNSEFENISQTINHRGPDYSGYYYNKINNDYLKLSHKRLSIQDLSSKGNQPMISNDGKSILIFNGEIYNHLNLRKKIQVLKNMSWKSSSDTETLLNFLISSDINNVLTNIKGMFAFVFIDLLKKKIILARDIAGEKPLYFFTNQNNISFASDLKPISSLPNFKKEISLKALSEYLKLNYIPCPNTIYNNIFKIPPASYLEINLSEFKKQNFLNFEDLINCQGIIYKKYWNIDNIERKYDQLNLENNLVNNLDNILSESVNSQLLSDASLGAFLSGGIDSSLIVSIASKQKSQFETFTIGYDFDEYDESKNASKIAKFLNTKHTTHICKKNDVIDKIPFLSSAFTEPFADTSQIPTMLVSEIASKNVKVALSGDGGDEIFCGYNRYIITNKISSFLFMLPYNIRVSFLNLFVKTPNYIKRIILSNFINVNELNINSKINIYIKKLKKIKEKYDLYDQFITEWDIFSDKILKPNINHNFNFKYNEYFNKDLNLIQRMMDTDFLTYLPDDILCKVDRSSMFYSLETRAPYLDKNVIAYGKSLSKKFKINKYQNKVILRKLLSKYIPENLIENEKKGFGIPIGKWLKNELKDYLIDSLSKKKLNAHNFFDNDTVDFAVNNHLKGFSDNTNKLWSIIQFNNWYEDNF